jgi:hypothetical protein
MWIVEYNYPGIKSEWLAAGVLLISNHKQHKIGQWSNMLGSNLHIRPTNGNQRPAALTNKKQINMTN